METAYLQTPIGCAEIEGNAKGITAIRVSDKKIPKSIIPNSLQDAAKQFQEYFEGTRKEFDLPLNPMGTSFQQKVWAALADIPYGKTTTYLELSKRLGNVKAIRAVAAANGQNPLWVVVPCHRVIGSNGDLIGYAGGLHRKKWLLEHESPVQQQKLF